NIAKMLFDHSLPDRSLRSRPAFLRTIPDGSRCRLSKPLIWQQLSAIRLVVPDSSPCCEGGDLSAGSRHPAGLPPAGAELAAVDDAVVLVAGGAEHGGSAHRTVADLAIKKIANRAALIACGEGDLDQVTAEPAA